MQVLLTCRVSLICHKVVCTLLVSDWNYPVNLNSRMFIPVLVMLYACALTISTYMSVSYNYECEI